MRRFTQQTSKGDYFVERQRYPECSGAVERVGAVGP